MPNWVIAIITIGILALPYIIPVNTLLLLLIVIVLTGISFSYTAIEGKFFSDFTWVILLSSATFLGLGTLLPIPIAMLVSLTILLLVSAIPANRDTMEKYSEWPSYAPLAMIFIGIIGAVIDPKYATWIILAPIIDVFLIGSLETPERERIAVSLYYVTAYSLAISLKPILISYALTMTFIRLVKPKLIELKYIPLDSGLRLVLGSGCIIIGC
ncbi:MAG: hypothetical protein GSR79_08810 [Desulfurococcales archaeon]|nr:hypothetical protein [Desulfurococcales archaeon]